MMSKTKYIKTSQEVPELSADKAYVNIIKITDNGKLLVKYIHSKNLNEILTHLSETIIDYGISRKQPSRPPKAYNRESNAKRGWHAEIRIGNSLEDLNEKRKKRYGESLINQKKGENITGVEN